MSNVTAGRLVKYLKSKRPKVYTNEESKSNLIEKTNRNKWILIESELLKKNNNKQHG